MAVRTRPGKWKVHCPGCERVRVVKEGRFSVIECKCGVTYRVEITGQVNRIE